jgi:hypothetical protein
MFGLSRTAVAKTSSKGFSGLLSSPSSGSGKASEPNCQKTCVHVGAQQPSNPLTPKEYGMQNVEQVKKQLNADVSNAIDAIANWREFDFRLDGVSCHYDYYCGIEVVDMIDLADRQVKEEFWKLLGYIHQFQEQIDALRLDPLEVNKIIYKYFQMEAKTMKALRRVRVDVPSYVESLSPHRLPLLDELYQKSKKGDCRL